MIRNVFLSLPICMAVLTTPNGFALSPVFRPHEQLLSDAHIVVVGTVVEESANIESRTVDTIGGKIKLYDHLSHIRIDSILKNDLTGVDVSVGGTVILRWRAQAPEPGRKPYSKKGQSGIWLLHYRNENFCLFGSRRNPMPIAQVKMVKDVLGKLDLAYKKAMEKQLPALDAKRREILAMTPVTQQEIDAAIANGVPRGVDVTRLCVMNTHRKPLESLLLDPRGKVVGGLPYWACDTQFRHGFLPVLTTVNGTYGDGNFVGSDGKLLLREPCTSVGPFSEGLAVIYRRDEGYGYLNGAGEVVIPCEYGSATPFSDGMALVTKGDSAYLIDKTGRVIKEGKGHEIQKLKADWAKVNSGDRGEGLIPYATGEEPDDKWGYRAKTEGMAISPRFIAANSFSEGVAVVKYNCWVRRPEVVSKDGSVTFSEKAPKHRLWSMEGWINHKGQMMNPIGFDSVHPFVKGFAIVWIYERNMRFSGIVDRKGNVKLVLCNTFTKESEEKKNDQDQ